MAISKVLPQKSHLLLKCKDAKRRVLLPYSFELLNEPSHTVVKQQQQQQSEKSWRHYCQQYRKEQLEKNQRQKEQQQCQQQQQQQHHKVFTNNSITNIRLSFLLSSPKLSTREGVSKLKGCNKLIESMKVVDNLNNSTLNIRRLDHLSKLAFLALSLLVISLSLASHANIIVPPAQNTERQTSEFNLNKHREILDKIAQESFSRNMNHQNQNQQAQQQFLHDHQLSNILNQSPTNNQPFVAAQQYQSHNNNMQKSSMQQSQLESEPSGNSRFVRLLSNHHHQQQQQQQQVSSAASNSEPVWTSSEPILTEQTSFISDASLNGNGGSSSGKNNNNKNYGLDPISGATSLPGLAFEQQQQQQQSGQYFSYRPLTGLKPTTPSISRQIIPPPFYELGLTPINTVQVEHHASEHGIQEPVSGNHEEAMVSSATSQIARQNGARSLNGVHHQLPQQHQLLHQPVEANLLAMSPTARSNMFQQQALEQNFGASSLNANSNLKKETEQVQNSDNSQPKNANEDSNNNNNNSNNNYNGNNNSGDSKSSADSTNNSSNESHVVDKAIEPRQKRRIFNRILKKAEWNHLFVELSKVFLRYFLDLALKDIIGKQSGGDTTTSRKKLDAQSELTDLLKDFVKTAISNI